LVQKSRAPRRRTRADAAWKRVLTDLLPGCLSFTAPELHAAVDWTVPPISLDKEFQAIARQVAVGQRVADHLVQLRLRSGEITWLVLHVEVQGQPQEDFAARMFTYYALLHLRLWRQRKQRDDETQVPLILGLALLTDDQPAWRPGPYEARGFDRGLRYDYWTVKLLDWQGQEADLAASDNPFALVVQAWLGWQAARGRVDNLMAVTRAILRQLRRSGLGDAETASVLAFLEEVIALPDELLDRMVEELSIEEDVPMAQVMSRFEREGMRKGRQEGRQEAYLELALSLLGHKFGPLDEATTERVRALSERQLLALATATLDFTDRTDLDRWLVQDAAQGR
jgi:hypothetical protein